MEGFYKKYPGLNYEVPSDAIKVVSDHRVEFGFIRRWQDPSEGEKSWDSLVDGYGLVEVLEFRHEPGKDLPLISMIDVVKTGGQNDKTVPLPIELSNKEK